jgi:hypothetical protein
MHDEQNIRPITAARIPVADLEIGCDIETTKAITITISRRIRNQTEPSQTAPPTAAAASGCWDGDRGSSWW